MVQKTLYTVGFTIHDAKNLVTPGGAPVDPLVVVRCCGTEYTTQIKHHKAGIVNWDESHIESSIELSQREWETAFIEFELQAAKAFWRNEVLGTCALQLSLVRARKTHQVKRQFPLIAVNDTEVKGYLSVTVFALAPGDTPPSPDDVDPEDEEKEVADDDLRKAVLNIGGTGKGRGDGTPYHLYVSVHRVEDLPRGKDNPDRNPFITCEFAGCRLESTHAQSTSSHTFNECFRLPVVTPVPEDSVLVKLWDWRFMRADELVAEGRLSFSELRGRPILPRWFLFYGFNKSEVPDVAAHLADGERLPERNYYMGRLMLSARAERLDKHENLMPAAVVPSRAMDGPPLHNASILADAYEVVGIPMNEVCVEVWCGPKSARTKWVRGAPIEPNEDDDLDGGEGGVADHVLQSMMKAAGYAAGQGSVNNSFSFDQKAGRVDSMHLQVPSDEKQQWDVLISVYGRGVTGAARVACNRLKLSSLPVYAFSDPRMPVWIPLKPTTVVSSQGFVGAVLMNIERANEEGVVRGKRKFVATREYEVRCYIYAARNLVSASARGTSGLPSPIARASCAGVARETVAHKENSNPIFLECLKLPCHLATDPSLNFPTVAPIVLDVFERNGSSKILLGRATCRYDRIRSKKSTSSSESTHALHPKWIKLYGGPSLTKRCGDILVCFELIPKLQVKKIPAQPMRPDLKKCTLVASCLGLRDIWIGKVTKSILEQLAAKARIVDMASSIERKVIRRPLILLSVPSFGQDGREKIETLLPWNPPNVTDPASAAANRSWRFASQTLSSFDFCSVVTIDLLLPEDPIFDPHLTMQLYDKSIKSKNFIGEATVQLLPLLPWVKDIASSFETVHAHDDFADTINIKQIAEAVRTVQGRLRPQVTRLKVGITALQDADQEIMREREAEAALDKAKAANVLAEDDSLDTEIWLLSNGVPKMLVEAYNAISQFSRMLEPISANMFSMNVFIPNRFVLAAEGANIAKRKNDEFFRPSVDGTLEDYLQDLTFAPLNVKKKIKNLPPGHDLAITGDVRIALGIDSGGQFRYDLPDEAARYVFDERKFRKKFRGEESYPPSIRIRAYVIRAIALVPQGGSRVINPYLSFSFGSTIENLRGSAKIDTVSPDFFWLQESDIAFPEQSRMGISVWSKEEMLGAEKDRLIGTTVLNLEDRWFSGEWQKMMNKNKVPIEYRHLTVDQDFDKVTGTLEIWVEMMSPAKAAEVPRFALKESLPTEVEIRIVLWGARSLSFEGLGKNSVDAIITANLECPSYKGTNTASQDTDVHYNSTSGSAVYNWRIVWPRVQTPVNNCVVQLAVYDYKPIGNSVFIGEVNLELRKYLEKVAQTLSSVEYDAELKLSSTNPQKNQGENSALGYVQVTLQIIAQAEASYKKAGLGRSEPNRDPKLTTPLEGRKWEDFLRAAGLRKDFSGMWFKFRIAFFVVLSLVLFIMCFVYPALFLQG